MTRVTVLFGILLAIASCCRVKDGGEEQAERWIYRYDGPASGEDRARGVAVGPDGNVYATGFSTGVDTDFDFTVISIDRTGNERWVYRYNGPGNGEDAGRCVVVGPDGNVYASGWSTGIGTGWDITAIGLTPAGQERWVYRYNGPGDTLDVTNDMAVGPDGNIYVTGYSVGAGTNRDLVLISLTPAGQERWVYRYNGPGNSQDQAFALAFGPGGNIVVGGASLGIGTGHDLFVVSLDPAGTEQWTYRYNGPSNLDDMAHGIAVGPNGNVYAAGTSRSGQEFDLLVIGLSPTGTERWVHLYDGPAGGSDAAYQAAVGPDGNFYTVGMSQGSGTDYDFIVISLTPDGEERWLYRYDGPGSGADGAGALAIAPDGNIFAGGYSTDKITDWDFTVIGLSSTGNERWTYRYNGPGNGKDQAFRITVGPDGNVYAAGHSAGDGTDLDFTIVCLGPDLETADLQTYGRDK